jgi:hypothetical protein
MRFPALFCFLSACASARPSAPAKEAERVIKACIVDDASAHVSRDVVEAAFSAAAEEYAARFGIVFEPERWVSAVFAPSGWPMDVAFALKDLCPDEAEVRFVFTDRFVEPKDVSMTTQGEGGQMAGDAHPYWGFVIVYSAEERWEARNAAGERALIGTLRHEIGHLFGLEHVQDRASFMYESSAASLGQWTDDAIRRVRAAKWKRWWPRT